MCAGYITLSLFLPVKSNIGYRNPASKKDNCTLLNISLLLTCLKKNLNEDEENRISVVWALV
jgi:hypothetical protein